MRRSGLTPTDEELKAILASVADAVLHATKRFLSPEEVADRAATFMASIDAPLVADLKSGIVFLERIAPLLVGLAPPFSALSRDQRRKVITVLSKERMLLRPLMQTLKLLTVFPYYTSPPVRARIGYVKFNDRPRTIGLDQTPSVHKDPHPFSGTPSPDGHYDVIVVGSGAGGAVMAYELMRQGLRVLVLEKGRYEQPTTFRHNEYEMLPRLYKHGGLQTTTSRHMSILQGMTVGGSTVVNNAIWLRPRKLDRVLADWAQRGAYINRDRLLAAYDALEAALQVEHIPEEICNAGTQPFLAGSAGKGEVLKHNRKVCLGCGWCNYGCRYNRKMSALVTFIPWAIERGASVLDRCHDVRLRVRGDKVDYVEYVRDGITTRQKADRVVVSAGSIGSSEILLASGIDQRGRVGKGFHALAGCTVTAQFAGRLDSFDKVGLTAIADLSDEFVVESFFSPPGAFSVTLGGWFENHAERMIKYPYLAQAGVMVAPAPRGRISLDRNGRTKIEIRYSTEEIDRLKEGVARLVRLFFDAHASSVCPSTFRDIEFKPTDDVAAELKSINDVSDFVFGSAHPQGGNAMSEDPNIGVVGHDFRVHGLANLFVADASVFPSNILANCQATVMAMSHMAVDHVAS